MIYNIFLMNNWHILWVNDYLHSHVGPIRSLEFHYGAHMIKIWTIHLKSHLS